MLFSSVSAVNFTHSAFAQDIGFGATTQQIPGISNKGVTGSTDSAKSGNTKPEASIKVAPYSGPSGSAFTVYGIGFLPSSGVKVTDPFTHEDDKVVADNSGTFADEISVPTSATPGTYTVEVDGLGWSNSYKAYHSAFSDATFTVDGKSSTVATNTAHHNSTPLPPPPKPPQPPTTPTSTSNGGGTSGVPSITIEPTSGYPGTEVKITGSNFEGTATLSAGGKVIAKSGNVNFGDFISVGSDGSLKGQVTIPSDAQPGPYVIQIDSDGPTAKATFTVLKKSIVVPVPTTPASTLKTTQTGTPNSNNPKTNGVKSTVTSNGVTSSSTSNSGSSNQPQSIPKPISKRADQNGNPVDSGDSFAVFKTVVGGDATPNEFMYTLILTGPSGTAQYSIGPTLGQGNPSETPPFNLDLPKGNTLSEGTFQIIETNPGDYTPTYSKGCSGSYANDGYYYTCSITNTKKVTTSTVPIAKGGTPLPQPGITNTQPGKTLTTNKSILPTPSNTGKLTIPTTPTKSTLPTTTKSTGTLTPKTPIVSSCPAGSFAISGKCVSKGAVVAILH